MECQNQFNRAHLCVELIRKHFEHICYNKFKINIVITIYCNMYSKNMS